MVYVYFLYLFYGKFDKVVELLQFMLIVPHDVI